MIGLKWSYGQQQQQQRTVYQTRSVYKIIHTAGI